MSDAMPLDGARYFERVESRQHDVCRAEGCGRESHDTGGVRKRGNIEAHRLGGIAAPIVRSHFEHGAPREARDAPPFRRAGWAAGGHEADEPLVISVRIAPILERQSGSALDERFER